MVGQSVLPSGPSLTESDWTPPSWGSGRDSRLDRRRRRGSKTEEMGPDQCQW